MRDPSTIRNLGIVAHINAGKTTLTERILFDTGKQRFMGEVDSGTATMDFLAEEQKRGISIGAAFTVVEWRGHRLHIVDTPGHVDFTAEVERCMRVLDGVVVVLDGVRGVESQTVTVWRQARRWGVPALVFVNKLDRVGASLLESLRSLRERLEVEVLPISVPTRDDSGAFTGMRSVLAEPAAAGPARDALVELAADLDERAMERFVADGDLPNRVVEQALRGGVVRGAVLLACGGSALHNVGVDQLLDAVVRYLPSPLDRPPVVDGDDPAVARSCDAAAPLCALAFKLLEDHEVGPDEAHALSAVRIYSGRLRAGDVVVASPSGRALEVRRLWGVHADVREPLVQAAAGDVVAVRFDGPPVPTGTTLHAAGHPIRLQPAEFPSPVLTVTVEPRAPADRAAVEQALAFMVLDDPTLQVAVAGDTEDLLLSGMGELHLDVVAARLREAVGDVFRLGRVQVACREVVLGAARETGEWRLPERDARFRAEVSLQPLHDGDYSFLPPCEVEVGELLWAGVADDWLAAVRSELRAELEGRVRTGLATGWPVRGVRVLLERAEVVGCTQLDEAMAMLPRALAVALQRACAVAGSAVVEPWMRLEVECPADVASIVLADLRSLQAEVREVLAAGSGRSYVACLVPLRRMLGYSSRLRSLSRGLATFTMEWAAGRLWLGEADAG